MTYASSSAKRGHRDSSGHLPLADSPIFLSLIHPSSYRSSGHRPLFAPASVVPNSRGFKHVLSPTTSANSDLGCCIELDWSISIDKVQVALPLPDNIVSVDLKPAKDEEGWRLRCESSGGGAVPVDHCRSITVLSLCNYGMMESCMALALNIEAHRLQDYNWMGYR